MKYQTVGQRVGVLYDKLANPGFTGRAAEKAFKEYLHLTRHPTNPNDALFLTRNINRGPTNAVLLLYAGIGIVAIISWVHLVNKAIEADKRNHEAAKAVRQRIKDILDEHPEFPDFDLPEGLFDDLD